MENHDAVRLDFASARRASNAKAWCLPALVRRLDVNVRQMFDVVVVVIIIPCMSALSSAGRASRSSVPCVGVGFVYVHRDQIQLAVVHPALGNYGVRKLAYRVGVAAQDYGFETIIVIEMRMHGGHREVVLIMLQ